MEEKNLNNQVSEEDKKKERQLEIIYPTIYLGNGLYSSYFANFFSMVMTDVYTFPVVLAGIIQIAASFVKWIYGPAFGALIDGFKFKNGKFWPWIRIGIVSMSIAQVLVFALPAFGVDPTNPLIIALVFFLQLCVSFSQPLYSTSINAVYPRISKDPQARNLLAVAQNIAREAGKSIFGAIVPVVLVAFTNKLGDAKAYAVLAVICVLITYLPHFLFSCALKDSYIEREAAQEAEKTKKQATSVLAILKAVFANKAVLGVTFAMIFYKAFSFMLSMSVTYVFKYYFVNFAAFGIYQTTFNLACIGGVCVGVFWRKLWKDTKKAFLAGSILQLAMLVVLCFIFKNLTTLTFTVYIGIMEFFAGLYDAYFVPMFAAGADYGEYTTGKRADGLTMAIYTMGVTFGSSVNTAIRTAVLDKAGYDAKALTADPSSASEALKAGLASLVTWIPAILCAAMIVCILVLYPLSDKKHAEIVEVVKERRAAAEAEGK